MVGERRLGLVVVLVARREEEVVLAGADGM
jgi:hypothetical protein